MQASMSCRSRSKRRRHRLLFDRSCRNKNQMHFSDDWYYSMTLFQYSRSYFLNHVKWRISAFIFGLYQLILPIVHFFRSKNSFQSVSFVYIFFILVIRCRPLWRNNYWHWSYQWDQQRQEKRIDWIHFCKKTTSRHSRGIKQVK